MGGQITPAQGGQYKTAWGGQFSRQIHRRIGAML